MPTLLKVLASTAVPAAFAALFYTPDLLAAEAKQVALFAAKVLGSSYLVRLLYRLTIVGNSRPQVPGKAYLDRCAEFREQTKEINASLQDEVFLVIGGTGFTGSALVEDLLKRGAGKVKVIARSLPPKVEYPYSRKDVFPIRGVEYVRGDVTDLESLKYAMQGTTVVFHTAASYGAPSFGSLRGGNETEKINLGGMQNIHEAARSSGTVKQIIFTSSCDTVFSGKDILDAEEHQPYVSLGHTGTHAEGDMAVGDHYARTKILAEKYHLEQDGKHGIRTISLRPNGIFGPGENSAFKKAVDPAFLLGVLPFYFCKQQKTDWTSVYNLVYAHVLAVHVLKASPERAGGKAYFITDEELTNNAAWEIFRPAIEAAGGPVKLWLKIPTFILPHMGHAQEWLDDFMYKWFGVAVTPVLTRKEAFKAITSHTHCISRAKKDLGYKPLFSTKENQQHTAEEIKRRYGML